MTLRSCAATVSLLGAVVGCAASKEPTGSLTSIYPNVAYNDVPVAVDIGGTLFRPAYNFDTMAAATATESGDYSATLSAITDDTLSAPASVPLDGVAWTSPALLKATVPAGVPAGAYDVVVTDPRGQSIELHQAFTSLGPDYQAPALTIISPRPGSIIGALTTIFVVVSADDGQGFVQSMQVTVSTAGTTAVTKECRGTPAHQKTCQLEFLAPTPAGEDDAVKLVVSAVDSVENGSYPDPYLFPLAPRPVVTGLTPSEGPSGGGTEIVLQGSDFVVPVDPSEGSALLIDGQAIPGAMITPTAITAVTLPHDPGVAMVQVATGAARSAARPFEFVAPPSVRKVSPSQGPLAGGTWIAVVGNHFRDGRTTIRIGGYPLEALCFVSAGRMEGRVPPGAAVGSAAVTAEDPIGGPGTLSGAFIYDAIEPTSPDPSDSDLLPMLCPGAQ